MEAKPQLPAGGGIAISFCETSHAQKRIQAELARLGFSGFRKDRGQIYARAPRPGPNRGVARVPDAACNGHVGLRLFLRPDGPVPDALRLLRHPTR
jgi:hypothetical protein